LRIYNTLSRRVEELEPQNNSVGIYVCGVTVYDDSHIGHARTVVVFDVLRRYLISSGYKVSFVQNFTDVDDKIINRAKAEGKKAEEISKKYIENYYRDFAGLNVLKPDHEPKATDHINEMIELIAGLIEKKHAYLTLNGVYFRVRSFSGYGKLSRKPIEELESGARIEVDHAKEDPLDFALWKFSSEDPAWESPWGKGRPGWHIECSAMSLKYLGNTFEIHGGGHDLVFPHHENEIAQSESYTGQEFAKIWMHSGMVTIGSQKMSKSLGNIVVIDKALKRWGMNALRLYCMSVHYSKPLDYTDELLQESVQRWRQIETCVYELRSATGTGDDPAVAGRMSDESTKAFEAAMDEDMNTALALTELLKFVTGINQLAAADSLSRQMADRLLTALQKMMGVLGLRVIEADWAEKGEIEELIKERARLREAKKFREADELRKKLLEDRSVELMDHRARTVWVKRERAAAG
jgi:cysteinyl-tRNA synthetase